MTDPHAKRALIAIGSSLRFGDMAPAQVVSKAISRLKSFGMADTRASRLFQSPCFPPGTGADYVNAVASMTLRHDMSAEWFLGLLHRIEAEHGRIRAVRWGPRTLDLDLLAVGDSVLPDARTQDHWRGLSPQDQQRLMPDRLILPHPRLQDRAFVLVPLADLAADWRHPRIGLTVGQMLALLPPEDVAAVTLIPVPDAAT